jgi:hypothetical protein
VKTLRGIHAGENVTIVGCGPSILALHRRDFPAGPVIAVNHSILVVRALRLPNVVYTMQKDGCQVHTGRAHVPILRCRCPSPRMVAPREPEVLLLSAAESSRCHRSYPRRHVFDVEADFGMRWRTMSVPVAVRIAEAMGCASVLMLGHDAYTHGVANRFYGQPGSASGYARAGVLATELAAAAGMPIEFR